MRLAPGADLRQLQKMKAGETVVVPPGTYKGGVILSDLGPFALDLTGAIITGGIHGLKFVNCHDFIIIGGETQDASNCGWFFERCKSFTLKGSKSTRAGVTGFLTTHVTDANFLECHGIGSVLQWGIYLSEQATKARIVGGEYSHNGRGAVQCNFDKGGGSDIEVRNLLAVHNQDRADTHAAAIQFASVTNGRILNCDIRDHSGRVGIEVWQRSRDVIVDQNKFGFRAPYGTACVSVSADSKATVGTMNQPDPRVPLLGKG